MARLTGFGDTVIPLPTYNAKLCTAYGLESVSGCGLTLCFARQEVRMTMPREYSDHPLCKQVVAGGGLEES